MYEDIDPVTGRQSYVIETIKGTEKAAHKRAEKAMIRLQARVDQQRGPGSSVALSYAIDEGLKTAEIEGTMRHGYLGYIDRTMQGVPPNVVARHCLDTSVWSRS